MEITNGRVRIQASRSLKVPTNVAFSSQDATVGISIEFDATGDLEAVKDRALVEQSRLAADVLLAVATQLGVELSEVDGVLTPVVAPGPAKPEAAKRNYSPRAPRGSGSGGAGKFNDPIFNVELLDGTEVDVKDFRALKASGKFKPTAPDFAPTDGGNGWYVENRDGTINKQGAAIADQVDAA